MTQSGIDHLMTLLQNLFNQLLAANSVVVAEIKETQRHLEKVMIAAADVKALILDFNAVLISEQGAAAALKTAQDNFAALQQQVAELNDPALSAALAATLQNAANAIPPANPIIPVGGVDPNAPPVTDPNAPPVTTATPPAAGDVTNPDGSVTHVDGTITRPDGSVINADGIILTPAPAAPTGSG
jgi:hypothetical protein